MFFLFQWQQATLKGYSSLGFLIQNTTIIFLKIFPFEQIKILSLHCSNICEDHNSLAGELLGFI